MTFAANDESILAPVRVRNGAIHVQQSAGFGEGSSLSSDITNAMKEPVIGLRNDVRPGFD